MNLIKHIKLAAFAGFLTGSLIGLVDVVARLIAWSFEWFEFYQALFLPITITIIVFLVLCLFIEVCKKTIKLKIKTKQLHMFYLSSSVSFLVLFYGLLFVNFVILGDPLNFLEPASFGLSFLVLLVSVGIGIILYFKVMDRIILLISNFGISRLKKISGNYIFVLLTFIIISFFIDVYLLNHVPNFTSKDDVKDYPNVVIITLDAQRADHMLLYGYPKNTTPNLNILGEKAVVFDNAIAPTSWTLPSHTSILTGKNLHNHNTTLIHQFVDDSQTLIAEILKDKGYVTVGYSGGPFTKSKYGMGQGLMMHKDRLDFFAYMHSCDKFGMEKILNLIPGTRTILRTDGERSSTEINKDVFKFLEKNADQTFFLFIHYFDPHDPYNLVDGFSHKFTNETTNMLTLWELNLEFETFIRPRNQNISKHLLDFAQEIYDTEIFYLDNNLGKLFDKLDELGIKDRTLIVVTADHGEEFYEHGGVYHTETLYEEVTHVPLIIYYPQEFEPKRIEKRVGIINIFPTILDMLNMEEPENIDGVSLLPLIKNEGRYTGDYVLSELYGREGKDYAKKQVAISDNDWKLIEVTQWENVSSEEEIIPSGLFNLRTDPKEQRNLYDIYIDERELLQKYIINMTSDS